jgi:hypothetical protein
MNREARDMEKQAGVDKSNWKAHERRSARQEPARIRDSRMTELAETTKLQLRRS